MRTYVWNPQGNLHAILRTKVEEGFTMKFLKGSIVVGLLTLFLLCSCGTGKRNTKPANNSDGIVRNSEATGFTIQDFKDYKKLTVSDPWQKSTGNHFEYFLLKRGEKVPEALQGKQVFLAPVQKVVCLSTTHIGFLDALGKVEAIAGLSGCNYVTHPEVKKGVAAGRIQEVGYEQGLNYELILQLKPDVVFAYGVGSEINAQLNKLKDLGIPVVLVGEYLEKSPVAKAEWIKFFGSFFGEANKSADIFKGISDNYYKIKGEAAKLKDQPTVLTGLPFKDTWWMAGGQSNLAVMIADAGGEFLWNDNASEEAFPVSLEEVFMRAAKADFWINCGSVGSIAELMAYDQRFATLPALKNQSVFNNNLRSVPGGGNDYWESGVVHPDLVLSDLVKILHPEISQGKEFYYYRRIE